MSEVCRSASQSQSYAVHFDCHQQLGNVPFEISHLTAVLVLLQSANAGRSGEKPSVRQKVESAGKIAQ
jgi:hypothetical protein